jgi:putative ABC transport system permease protein
MMFLRLLWELLEGSRGRLMVAFVAIVSGAAVISALLGLQGEVQGKLAEQFRLLGANVVISREAQSQPGPGLQQATLSASGSPQLMEQDAALDYLERNGGANIVAAAPFLYVVAQVNGAPVVTTGTWLDQLPKLDPTWKIDGSAISSREDETDCLIGRNAAKEFHLGRGGDLELQYLGKKARLRVAGVIDAGGAEDNQIFVNLPVAQELAGLQAASGRPREIELVQVSVSGDAASIGKYAAALRASLPGYDVRPIPQVTEAEGELMNRIRLLIVGMVALILVLTALCVLATMAALAMERRQDVGLMKALGGSISRIVGLFLAEVGVVGAAGGIVGCAIGLILSRWMGQRVFAAAISPRWEVFPFTVALMIVVAMAGALPLRMLGKVKPAVILRGE